jgi:DNA repair protein SbcD/Mre11
MSKLILTADNHFQINTPVSRKDDFIATQIRKMSFLKELSKKHNATILNAGDTTHKAREERTTELLNLLMDNLPHMVGILGNHDLLAHRMDNLPKSIMSILIKTGLYQVLSSNEPYHLTDDIDLYGFHWGEELCHFDTHPDKTNIAIWHKLILGRDDTLSKYVSNPVFGDNVLKNFPEYDIILTGDNHTPFIFSDGDRHLVNPGSLLRLNTKQKDFKPRVYLYDTNTKALELIYIPIEEDVISTNHLSEKEATDFSAYIEAIENNDITIDFEGNLKNVILEADASSNIISIIENFLGD